MFIHLNYKYCSDLVYNTHNSFGCERIKQKTIVARLLEGGGGGKTPMFPNFFLFKWIISFQQVIYSEMVNEGGVC